MKIGIYARVSLDETDRENKRFQDPENQLILLREYAYAMDYEITDEYVDWFNNIRYPLGFQGIPASFFL